MVKSFIPLAAVAALSTCALSAPLNLVPNIKPGTSHGSILAASPSNLVNTGTNHFVEAREPGLGSLASVLFGEGWKYLNGEQKRELLEREPSLKSTLFNELFGIFNNDKRDVEAREPGLGGLASVLFGEGWKYLNGEQKRELLEREPSLKSTLFNELFGFFNNDKRELEAREPGLGSLASVLFGEGWKYLNGEQKRELLEREPSLKSTLFNELFGILNNGKREVEAREPGLGSLASVLFGEGWKYLNGEQKRELFEREPGLGSLASVLFGEGWKYLNGEQKRELLEREPSLKSTLFNELFGYFNNDKRDVEAREPGLGSLASVLFGEGWKYLSGEQKRELIEREPGLGSVASVLFGEGWKYLNGEKRESTLNELD